MENRASQHQQTPEKRGCMSKLRSRSRSPKKSPEASPMKKTKVKKTKPSKASDNGSQKSGFFSRFKSWSKSPPKSQEKSKDKKKGNDNVTANSNNSQIISDYGYEPKGSIRTPIAESGNVNLTAITPIIEEVKDDAAPSEPAQNKKMFKSHRKAEPPKTEKKEVKAEAKKKIPPKADTKSKKKPAAQPKPAKKPETKK